MRETLHINDGDDIAEVLKTAFSKEKPIPKITEAGQIAVRQFLKDNDYIHYVSVINGGNKTVGATLADEGSVATTVEAPGQLIGPTYLNGEYIETGLSIWVPRQELHPSQVETSV